MSKAEVNSEESATTLKESGNVLFNEQKYEEALEKYTQAIELVKLNNQKSWKAAKKIDKRLLTQLYQNRAAVYEKLNSHEEVIKETSMALDLNPKYVKARLRRVKAYRDLERFHEAYDDVVYLSKVIAPHDIEVRKMSVQLGQEVLKEVGTQEALKILKNRKQIYPSKDVVKRNIMTLQNCPISKVDLQKIGCIENWGYNLAVDLLKAKDYDRIMDLCTEELLSPESKCKVEASYLRGTMRFVYAVNEGTVEDFDYVIANSDNKELIASAYLRKGIFYGNLHGMLHEESVKCRELSVQIWPENADVWVSKGQVEMTKGDLVEALKCFRKAIELKPDHAIAHATECFVLSQLAKTHVDKLRLQQQFQTVAEKFPTCPDVFLIFANFLEHVIRQHQIAELNISKAIELDPKNTRFLAEKTMLQLRQTRNCRKAIQELNNAVKIDDKNPALYTLLGNIYLQMGMAKEALEYIVKAMKVTRSLKDLIHICSLKKTAESLCVC